MVGAVATSGASSAGTAFAATDSQAASKNDVRTRMIPPDRRARGAPQTPFLRKPETLLPAGRRPEARLADLARIPLGSVLFHRRPDLRSFPDQNEHQSVLGKMLFDHLL